MAKVFDDDWMVERGHMTAEDVAAQTAAQTQQTARRSKDGEQCG